MLHRKEARLFTILLCGMCWGSPAMAAGLSTTFVDVLLKDVVVGEATIAHDQTGRDLVITNVGSSPVHVRVDALVPSKGELRDKALAIPEAGWVSIHPESLDIPPSGQGKFQIVIQVPAKRSIKGKQYQVMIWSHAESVKGGGVSFNTALLSRLRFTTKKH